MVGELRDRLEVIEDKGPVVSTEEAVESPVNLIEALIEKYKGDPKKAGAIEALNRIKEHAEKIERKAELIAVGGAAVGGVTGIAIGHVVDVALHQGPNAEYVAWAGLVGGSIGGAKIIEELGKWRSKRLLNDAVRRFDIAVRHL